MKVLIADKFEAAGINQLKEMGCEVVFDPDLKEAALGKALGEFKPAVLVVRSTRVTAEHLGTTEALKLVLRAGSGYNTIDIDHATHICESLNQRGINSKVMHSKMDEDR